jgi:multidrug efflux pump subunit AcrA (membrane-fusion protein)
MKIKHILWFLPFLLVGCGETDPSQLKEKLIGGPAEERVIAVGVQRIDTVGGLVRNSYPGYLEEGNTVDISFKYGGTLQSLNVKEGSTVRKGQVLARVSSPQMESTQRSAQATLEQAQDAYDRLKKVHDNGKFVWVAKDGRATRQNITISGYSGTGVVVSEGLHSGDIVIVEGYQKVSEGMKVDY